jgi:LuxR family maltose regulon positive regulatory protein
VLDDYHVIEESAIHEALSFLLEHLPPLVHLVLITRADPPLPLVRLRARDQLTELRAVDLRFTPEETAAFLNQVMGLDLSPEEVAALDTRTEGWIVGLQMAALSLERQTDRAAFVADFAGDDRYVADYLMEEVLRREPPFLRTFLLHTSVLNRLSAPLCDALMRNVDTEIRDASLDSQAILEQLEQSNLFLMPLDNRRRWFRYHHLFADLLRQRLGEAHPGRVPVLHRAAFAWFREHGLYDEAIQHAFRAGDFAAAADLIEEIGLSYMIRGGLGAVKNWIATLPEALLRQRPALCVTFAWALELTGRWDAVERWLEGAEEALDAGPWTGTETTAEDLRGQIAVIRSYRARRHNEITRSVALLREAQTRLASDNRVARTGLNLNLGQALVYQGDLTGAEAALQEAHALGEASGNELAGLGAAGALAVVYITQGRLRRAEAMCRRILEEYSARHERTTPALCHVYAYLGSVLYEWNELAQARAFVTQAVQLSHSIGYGAYGTTARNSTALLEWIRHLPDHPTTDDAPLPEHVVSILDGVPAEPNVVDVMAWRVRVWLARDDPAAYRWAEAYQAGESVGLAWPAYADLALARVLWSQGRTGPALDRLGRVRRTAEETGGRGWSIAALTLEAVIRQSLGENQRALSALSQALTLAEPEGFTRTFLDEGEPLVPLLRRAADEGVSRDYAGRLLTAFEFTSAARTETRTNEQRPSTITQRLPEPLSEREQEVLELLAAGLTYREAAEALVVSVNTVRYHVKNLYGKLGASRRTEALARARELGYLSPDSD